jgi:hypothetical protein
MRAKIAWSDVWGQGVREAFLPWPLGFEASAAVAASLHSFSCASCRPSRRSSAPSSSSLGRGTSKGKQPFRGQFSLYRGRLKTARLQPNSLSIFI